MEFLLFLLLGTAAIIFSILAWRLKNNVHFVIGICCTSLILLICLFNYDLVVYLFLREEIFGILFFATFLVIPIIFLVKAKQNKPSESFDGSQATGAVTEDYLDEIINAPDEEIDFEDGVDLR